MLTWSWTERLWSLQSPALQPFGICQLVDSEHSGESQGLLEGPNYGLLRKNSQLLSYWSLHHPPAIPIPLWYQKHVRREIQVTGDGIMPNLNTWIINSSIKNLVFNIMITPGFWRENFPEWLLLCLPLAPEWNNIQFCREEVEVSSAASSCTGNDQLELRTGFKPVSEM